MACRCIFIIWMPFLTYATAFGQRSSSETHSTVGQDEVHSLTRSDLPAETFNPNPNQQQRLRVKWGKPFVSKFQILVIPGRLLLQKSGGQSNKPVDWVQGVQVVISRKHNQRPDWTKRHDKTDSAWDDCVTNDKGEFKARFSLYEISRPVGDAKTFQIAVSLGQKTGRTIKWTNATPVLRGSKGTVMIRGPDPLSPTLQIINGAPSVKSRDYDPVALIRAVNHLHSLGKEGAISALREFLKIAGNSSFAERDPANIDTSDCQCVFLIVRLLFEPKGLQDKLPSIAIGHMSPYPAKEDAELWPLYPLAVQEDIPFLVMEWRFVAGSPEHPANHVDWAEKHGKLRVKPLRPSDNPLRAVDTLRSMQKTIRLFQGDRAVPLDNLDGGMLREQSWRMIEHFVGPVRTSEHFGRHRNYDPDADWERHKRIAQQFKFAWDEAKQQYTGERP
jgi:hypothetical protein